MLIWHTDTHINRLSWRVGMYLFLRCVLLDRTYLLQTEPIVGHSAKSTAFMLGYAYVHGLTPARLETDQ